MFSCGLRSAYGRYDGKKGDSQESFAYACELDRTDMGGIERGERNVGLRNIERIASTLGISLSELMDGL